MTKSKARVALEEALAQASTPQEKSDIANRLSLLFEREARNRSRRRRERTKITANKPAPEKKDDGDEPFLNDDGTPFEIPPPLPLTPQAPVVAPPPPIVQNPIDDANDDVPIGPAGFKPDGTGGWTRTISAANVPGARFWTGERWEDDIDPQSTVGAREWSPFTATNATCDVYHADTREFESERKARLQREQTEREAEWMRQR
jgi:hypothetical protein